MSISSTAAGSKPLSPAVTNALNSSSVFQTTQSPSSSGGKPFNVFAICLAENRHRMRSSLEFNDCFVCVESLDALSQSGIRNDLISLFTDNPPDLLWINVPHWESSTKIEDQRRIAICFAILLTKQLADKNRHVVLEGCLHHFENWFPDRLRKALNNPRLSLHHVYWCALGLTIKDKPICRYSKLICTLPQLPSKLIQCCEFNKKSVFRHFKASRTLLFELQTKLHDQLIPLFRPAQSAFPASSDQTKSQPRPNLPKKIASATEKLEADEPGEHADDQFTKDEDRPRVINRKKPVEEVFEDCGDSTVGIDELEKEAFAMFDCELPSSANDDTFSEVSTSEEEHMFDSTFLTFAFPGSDCQEGALFSRPFCADHQDLASFLAVLDEKPGIHDICELFGASGNVLKLCIRRKLVTGPNFDLSTGVDLLKSDHLHSLWTYLSRHRPRIVVCGPPCTAFSSWQQLNKHHNPERYYQALRVGTRLANLTADIAAFQLRNNNHFIVENPASSQLWNLKAWQQLRDHPQVGDVILDQCMVGLVDPAGTPTLKPTRFLASHPVLIRRLNIRCDGRHPHAQLAGSVNGVLRTKFAQSWPKRLVELLVQGILELFSLQRRTKAFPAAATTEQCRGCKAHAIRTDPRHDRGPTCKFPYDDTRHWECAACQRHRPSNHPAHQRTLGVCQWAEAPVRRSSTHASHPRAPKTMPHSAPPERDETAPITPPPVENFTWTPVVNLEMITLLDRLRTRDGWTELSDGMALTSSNCKVLKNCEPRLNAQNYKFRSTYCWFDEIGHPHSNWWQLEDNAQFTDPAYPMRQLLPLPAPALSTSSKCPHLTKI